MLHVKKDMAKEIPLQKAVLKGKNMDNYFKPPGLKLTIEGNLGEKYDYTFVKGELENFTNNKFVYGVIESIHKEWNSVEIIETLPNDMYDKLLSENIVFLNLIEPAAVNTIIECIVRCTPVLVNRHASIEEMLGCDYPFYYDDLTEAGHKVNNLELIKKTHKYLLSMNKKKFNMEYFMQDMDNWFKTHLLTEKVE
jgi:hypothetical protein